MKCIKMKKRREFLRSLFVVKDIEKGNLYRRKYPRHKIRVRAASEIFERCIR